MSKAKDLISKTWARIKKEAEKNDRDKKREEAKLLKLIKRGK